MVTLEIVDANGEVPDPPVEVRFGPEGGTIGRAATNLLRLDDPQRSVSRVHAQVVRRKEGPRILARSANPMTVDGGPLEIGDEAPLAVGTTIVIGGYTLRARPSH